MMGSINMILNYEMIQHRLMVEDSATWTQTSERRLNHGRFFDYQYEPDGEHFFKPKKGYISERKRARDARKKLKALQQ